MSRVIDIVSVITPDQIDQIRTLFLEYGESLGFSLCFQGFDQELAGLPGDYAPPHGSLLIAYVDHEPAGCVALHRLEGVICEMKRLYVRPAHRRLGLGRQLAERIIEDARARGYNRMRLDTINTMTAALTLYRDLGFVEIPPYRPNPIDGAVYLELVL